MHETNSIDVDSFELSSIFMHLSKSKKPTKQNKTNLRLTFSGFNSMYITDVQLEWKVDGKKRREEIKREEQWTKMCFYL